MLLIQFLFLQDQDTKFPLRNIVYRPVVLSTLSRPKSAPETQ